MPVPARRAPARPLLSVGAGWEGRWLAAGRPLGTATSGPSPRRVVMLQPGRGGVSRARQLAAEGLLGKLCPPSSPWHAASRQTAVPRVGLKGPDSFVTHRRGGGSVVRRSAPCVASVCLKCEDSNCCRRQQRPRRHVQMAEDGRQTHFSSFWSLYLEYHIVFLLYFETIFIS